MSSCPGWYLLCAITCLTGRWNDRELKFARTVIFTVEEINRDAKLLPGVILGYRLYNGCGSENLIRAALEAVTAEGCSGQVQALLGHSSSGVSKNINILVSQLSIPQVWKMSLCLSLYNIDVFLFCFFQFKNHCSLSG